MSAVGGSVDQPLLAPEPAAIGEIGRLGAAPEAEQIEGMHLMALSQGGEVVAPVVGTGAEAMHEQQGWALRLRRSRRHRVHRMAAVAPGLDAGGGG